MPGSAAPAYVPQAMQQVPGGAVPPPVQSLNQTAEFFLSNYRLGKTLGIGSFGKVSHMRSRSAADWAIAWAEVSVIVGCEHLASWMGCVQFVAIRAASTPLN